MLSDDLWFDPSLVYIDGKWAKPANDAYLALLDPSTGPEMAKIARGSALDIDASVLT